MIRLTVGLAAACLMLGAAACTSSPDPNAPREPKSVLKQLPLGLFLVNLCPDAGTPENIDRELRRRAEVLLRELETHPDWIVPWTYYYEDADPETTEITVRQLGREHLQSFKDLEEAVQEPNGEPCEPELQRRLEEAIG